MKSSLSSRYSSYLKAALLLIQLVMCFGSPTVAQAGGKARLVFRPVAETVSTNQALPAPAGSVAVC
jgi:hypothetical protein